MSKKNTKLESKWCKPFVSCESHKEASIVYVRKSGQDIIRRYGWVSEAISESPSDDSCELCGWAEKEAKDSIERMIKCREAMQHPDYMFGRATRYGGIRIVHSDPTSPSGRIAAAWCESDEFDQLNKELDQTSRPQDIVQLGE